VPNLRISLLGPPRAERDGVPIEVDTRKAIALLAYLAVTRTRHSRDALAVLLWPDNDQTSARAALRRTLSALNKALAGDWLDADRENVELLRQPALWIDVDEFRARLSECRTHGHPESEVCPRCVRPLADAVLLYRDDFLAGFSLRDSSNFDDWQFFQNETLRRELAGALERLVRCYTNQAEFESAITHARRWLALDPLHEPAHRELMRLYAWSNQRAAAVHQYRECVRVLDQELGVPPLEATTELYQAIKEHQMSPPAPTWAPIAEAPEPVGVVPSSRATSSPVDLNGGAPEIEASAPAYPLVGRAPELAILLRAYKATGPRGHAVVLEGEAGIGKSRLAEALFEQAQERGATVIVARCYEGEAHLAYAPFTEALRAALAQPDGMRRLEGVPEATLSEVARLVPEIAAMRNGLPQPAPLDSPGAQIHFFDSVSRVLAAACGVTLPGLLVFEDLHWADAASLELLTFLLRRLRNLPLCLLLTWRSEQMLVGNALRSLLGEMERTGAATLIRLGRLDREAVMDLVEAAMRDGTPLPEEIGGRLYHETEGLPFFLVEYLNAIANGAQPFETDQWSLPGGVRDLLRSRLTALSQIGRQVLSAAAVIGRSFDYETLREASGRGEEETVTALEELIEQGLIDEVAVAPNEQRLVYDFSHEKLRALVYGETSQLRRQLLHGRVAEALNARVRGHRETGALAAQIAYHYRLSGREALAADYFYLAGEYARGLYANAEALAHYRSALALEHPDPAALHEAIGDVQTLLGEYGEAVTSYETAAALAETGALPGLEHKLGILHHRRGEWELAQSHFEAALAALGDDGPAGERARILADWSLTAHMYRGQAGSELTSVDPWELAHKAQAGAEAAGDTRALAQAHNILGVLARETGDLQAAQRHLETSLRLAEQLHDSSVQAAALNNLALAYGAGGDLDRALTLEESALALCVAQGDRHREAALHNNLSDLLHAAGRSELAMEHLKQAVAIYSEIGVEAGTVQPEIWKLAEW
jgi:DNA-binding SARP family transcriptional activator